MSIITPEWVKDAIFYQIFPDRFAKSDRLSKDGLNLEPWDSAPTPYGFKGGDLLGVVEHLDYLQDLGITAIYFNPAFASASNHRYHPYDYYNIDPLLGGNTALRELLNAAHARGIRVVLDGVFNHASRGFWQFHHTLENGAGSPYVDWFHFNPDRLARKEHLSAYPNRRDQYLMRMGKSSYDVIGYKAWYNNPALPKFNTNTPAVREFLWGVGEYWIKFGVDGWRLDVPVEIDDDSFWREFRRRVKAANPDAYIVGEIWHESQRWLKGDQFDAVMNYLLTGAMVGFFIKDMDPQICEVGEYKNYLRPLTAKSFAERIDYILNLYDPAVTQVLLNLLDSHDTPRFITTAKGDLSALRLAMLFMFTYPGAPCIYYGDEIGLQGRQDPDCRKSFPWDESRWNRDLFSYTKQCNALRKAYPSLRHGTYHRLYASNGVYAFGRKLKDETLVIALNADDEGHTMDIPADVLGLTDGPLTAVFGEASAEVQKGKILVLKLAPRSVAVLKEKQR